MQYLLVGFAECLFYLLLLSVSEHLGFGPTYLLGALATVGLIASTPASPWGPPARPPAGARAAASYAFLYAALQSEDYALLIGSLACLSSWPGHDPDPPGGLVPAGGRGRDAA